MAWEAPKGRVDTTSNPIARVDTPKLSVGVLFNRDGSRVIYTPPDVAYMRGWERSQFEAHCEAKKWTVTWAEVPND